MEWIGARYCILATGGVGRVYEYTTNSAIATGDGITLAYELGANIRHLSRIQFHPTAFAADKDRERFLISEAVRGEGAVLLNCNGERFAHKYDERGELAPRDVVSNAIMQEAKATRSERFYLDITHKDPEFVKNRFPMIYARCLEEGIDITKDRIPVFPVPALPDGRDRRRFVCAYLNRQAVRGGRMLAHGRARRKPLGEQFAFGGARVFTQGGLRYYGKAESRPGRADW